MERFQFYQEKQQKNPPADNNVKSTRIKRNETSGGGDAMLEAKLPMLASACPGWICYAEKTQGEYIIPYISRVKSPQQILGSLIKKDKNLNIYHISVQPCYDKKLEASRKDFYDEQRQQYDVDCVISTGMLF